MVLRTRLQNLAVLLEADSAARYLRLRRPVVTRAIRLSKMSASPASNASSKGGSINGILSGNARTFEAREG